MDNLWVGLSLGVGTKFLDRNIVPARVNKICWPRSASNSAKSRHVCLPALMSSYMTVAIYPWLSSTDSYRSPQLMKLFFFSFTHNRQTEGCKACQVKDTIWAQVFKIRIWSWSLISNYMTKRSHILGDLFWNNACCQTVFQKWAPLGMLTWMKIVHSPNLRPV